MKTSRRFLLLALACLLATLPLGAALAGDTPVLTVYVTNQGRTWNPDSPSNIEIQRRLGITLDIDIAEPNSNRFNLMIASGDLPDLCYVSEMKFLEYLPTGYFMPLDDLIEAHGPNLKAQISQEAWDMTAYDGQTYVIPYTNIGSKYLTHIRQDWLEAVSLDMPKTIDDLTEVLHAFTFNDPDGNGKQDTYGLGNGSGDNWIVSLMMIFGAYGGMPGQYYDYDGAVLPYAITDDYRAALSYVNELWAAGVIDPELFILQEAQARQKMAQGIAGVFNSWWSNSTQTLQLQLQMNKLDPNVEWLPVKPTIEGADGRTGMRDQGSISGCWLVNADSKHPELAVKFLDYLATDEGFYLAAYGIEGQDYELKDGYVYRTESGQQAYNDGWLDVMMQYVRRQDILNLQQNSPTDNPDELLPRPFRNYVNSGEISLYTNLFYGMPVTTEASEYGANVDSYIEQMAIEFMTGQTELNDTNWTTYMETWKQKGGLTILEAEVAQLNTMKNTSYTVGVQ